MDSVQILRASIVLFAIIDVLGTLPYILVVRKREGELHPLRAAVVTAILMFFFLITGDWLLGLFGLTVHSFALAGSVIILASSVELIFGRSIYKEEQSIAGVSSVVPIAFPMLAGAGTITTIISLRAEYQPVNISVAILLNVLIIYIVLKSTGVIERVLSPMSFMIIRKLFGIIVLAIGIQMFYTHVVHLLQNA